MKKLLTDIMLELHVPSFDIAKTFYGDLGFEVVWERNTADPESRFLVMRKGNDSIINFYSGSEDVYDQTYFRQFPKTTPRGYGVELTIPIDGLTDFYNLVVAKHNDSIVKHLDPRSFRAGGRKDFRVIDPFGFYLCFVERYNWVDGRDKTGKPIP